MTSLNQNRRRHARISINADYQLILDGQEYTGKVDNISLSGAFLMMPNHKLTASDIQRIADLRITINDENVQLKCEIVYVEPSEQSVFPAGIGVAFCHDEDTATSIWNLAIAQDMVQKDLFQIPDKPSDN
ncbi:MAG: PilZ domain-containing protein [Methylovulum sp.]|nr:PilZ domain-containing protein [Methylovulum sp.]